MPRKKKTQAGSFERFSEVLQRHLKTRFQELFGNSKEQKDKDLQKDWLKLIARYTPEKLKEMCERNGIESLEKLFNFWLLTYGLFSYEKFRTIEAETMKD
ncbi:hypothetical protein [Fibrobacter sp.]|uniref:hypothetical protein n=1 Tax=Fibrobacter sp. TaxID=35828 RepID=UPI003890B1A7